jgi:hypothetical protein
MKEVLFIRKIYMLLGQSRCARLQPSALERSLGALEHSPGARLRIACAREHSTAQYSQGAAMKAMVLGLRGISSVYGVHSIAAS